MINKKETFGDKKVGDYIYITNTDCIDVYIAPLLIKELSKDNDFITIRTTKMHNGIFNLYISDYIDYSNLDDDEEVYIIATSPEVLLKEYKKTEEYNRDKAIKKINDIELELIEINHHE